MNNKAIHSDNELWHNYMSVHLNDRFQLAHVVNKHVKCYQHISVRINSNFWNEKRANEQFRLSSRSFCKMSIFSVFSFFRSQKYFISSMFLVTDLILLFTELSFLDKIQKSRVGVKKKWTI